MVVTKLLSSQVAVECGFGYNIIPSILKGSSDLLLIGSGQALDRNFVCSSP